jgi:hypothetical protein
MALFRVVFVSLAAGYALSACQDEECSAQPETSKKHLGQALMQHALNFTSSAAPPGLLVIPLERRLGTEKSFYVGNITVGLPAQTLQVLFDTSSNGLVVMHTKCRSKACLSHKRYSSMRSSTAEHVDLNGKRVSKMALLGKTPRDAAQIEITTADLPSGNISGFFVRDRVCLQREGDTQRTCVPMSFVTALNVTDMPFSAMPCDAIVGLGPQMPDDPDMFSFGARFLGRQGRLPIFGMTFGESRAEVHIGGYHPSAIAAPLHWIPAHNPQVGYWQAEIKSVRIGDKTFDMCSQGCHAIVDTSATKLGVMEGNLPQYKKALKGEVGPDGSCQGQVLEFDLGGMSISLDPVDYMAADCTADLGPLDLREDESSEFRGVFTLGTQALRRYFVAFDWEQKTIGFAPATGFSTSKKYAEDLDEITV